MDNSAKNINIRVCILNWNGGETLHRCIDSLLQNTTQDFSITIIDNGSTDGSLDNIKSSIEVIKLDKNYGYSKGYNLGIEKISDNDEYIVLLNYDTSVSSNFISSLSNQIKINGKKYIYGVKILYKNNKNLIWYAGGRADLSKGIIFHVGLRQNSKNYNSAKKTDYITGCCLVVHKDNYQRLNGFDTDFFMYNEDVDFCIRAKGLGLECLYLPDPVIYHDVSLSTGGNYSIKKISLKLKSTYILFRKHYSFPKSLLLLIIYLNRTIFNLNGGNEVGHDVN